MTGIELIQNEQARTEEELNRHGYSVDYQKLSPVFRDEDREVTCDCKDTRACRNTVARLRRTIERLKARTRHLSKLTSQK